MKTLMLLITLLLAFFASPVFATPSEDVTVGLDRLDTESDTAYYDRLFVQCGSWLPPYEDVKDAAKAKLIEIGATTLETLIPTWYASTNVRHRVTMEEIIKGIGPPAVPLLTPYLDDPDPIMRQRIVTSLGDLDDPKVLPALKTRLPLESDIQVLPALIDAVGKRGKGDTLLIDALTPHLAHADERVRRSTAVALGRIDDPEAVPALLQLLDDPLFSVRAPATEAIWTLTKDRWTSLSARSAGGRPENPMITSVSDGLRIELNTALHVLDSRVDDKETAKSYLHHGLGQDVSPPAIRRGMLRGIFRAWNHDHEGAKWALPLLDMPQPDLATEAVRLEIKATIAAQLEREAIAAAKAAETAP